MARAGPQRSRRRRRAGAARRGTGITGEISAPGRSWSDSRVASNVRSPTVTSKRSAAVSMTSIGERSAVHGDGVAAHGLPPATPGLALASSARGDPSAGEQQAARPVGAHRGRGLEAPRLLVPQDGDGDGGDQLGVQAVCAHETDGGHGAGDGHGAGGRATRWSRRLALAAAFAAVRASSFIRTVSSAHTIASTEKTMAIPSTAVRSPKSRSSIVVRPGTGRACAAGSAGPWSAAARGHGSAAGASRGAR